jgi:hypothetical protein
MWHGKPDFPKRKSGFLRGGTRGVLVFVPSSARIQVGSIDITKVGGGSIYQRAGLFARVEQVERGRYGFNIAEPGVIVGWPQLSSVADTSGNITYPSDVIQFNYECHWTAPTLVGKSIGGYSVSTYEIWAVNGKTSQEELWTSYGVPSSILATTGKFCKENFSLSQVDRVLTDLNRNFPHDTNERRQLYTTYFIKRYFCMAFYRHKLIFPGQWVYQLPSRHRECHSKL